MADSGELCLCGAATVAGAGFPFEVPEEPPGSAWKYAALFSINGDFLLVLCAGTGGEVAARLVHVLVGTPVVVHRDPGSDGVCVWHG